MLDSMISERPREEYNREAAHFFNQGSHTAAETGGSHTMLASLTRGMSPLSSTRLQYEAHNAQASCNLALVNGMTPHGHSSPFSRRNRQTLSLCLGRCVYMGSMTFAWS